MARNLHIRWFFFFWGPGWIWVWKPKMTNFEQIIVVENYHLLTPIKRIRCFCSFLKVKLFRYCFLCNLASGGTSQAQQIRHIIGYKFAVRSRSKRLDSSVTKGKEYKNKRRKGHLLILHLAAWTARARKSCDVANHRYHLVQYIKTAKIFLMPS
jgi:hypothetical protein